MSIDLKQIDLHDQGIGNIGIDFEARVLSIRLVIFSDNIGEEENYAVEFSDVHDITFESLFIPYLKELRILRFIRSEIEEKISITAIEVESGSIFELRFGYKGYKVISIA